MKTPADDTSSLSDAEILDMPEENLPLGITPELLNRRDAARQKKEETTRFEQDQQRQTDHDRHHKENADAYEHQLIVERFTAAMEDIHYREDLLLAQLDKEEKRARQRLQDIEDRAIKLHDDRRVYVGTNGDYLDEQGRTLQGKDREEAYQQHQNNSNAPTYAERAEVQQEYQTFQQMKQDILDAREQRRVQDKDGVSDDDMVSRTALRTASIAQLEARFHETLGAHGAATDETFASDDYMASFDDGGRTTSHAASLDGQETTGTLSKRFAPAAEGQGDQTTKNTPKPVGVGPSTNLNPSI